jgi:hypothetical protein
MPRFAVEVHPLAADEAEPPSGGTANGTKPRRRASGVNSIVLST